MNTSLYALAAEYQEAAEKLHNSELDDETIADTLEGMAGAIEVKAQNIAFVVRNTESMAAQIKQAEEGMAKRRKALENHAARLRAYLLANMQTTGIKKIDGGAYFSITIKNNPESVVIDAESQIPDEYMREIPASYVPDKVAIKSAIQEGEVVPGAHLTRTQSLLIK